MCPTIATMCWQCCFSASGIPTSKTHSRVSLSAARVQFFLCLLDGLFFFRGKLARGDEITNLFRIHSHSVARVNAGEDHAVSILREEGGCEALLSSGVLERIKSLH